MGLVARKPVFGGLQKTYECGPKKYIYNAIGDQLSLTSHINCIVARCLKNVVYLMACALSGHDDVALLNDAANDAESTQKSNITSLSLV